jgi:hypothetical protein
LTAASVPFNDPPLGGYAYCQSDFGTPCNEYPFYLNPNTLGTKLSLSNYETPTHLSFSDSPADPCLPGGNSQGIQGCNGINAPGGSFLAFTTRLLGILPDGTLVPLPDEWTWTSTYNGTSGGIATTLNFLPVDPGSGTGSVTITSVNGIQLNPVPSFQVATTASGLAYSRVSQTFNGTVTIKNVGSSGINAPLQIVLMSLTPGVTLVNATGSFVGNAFITSPLLGTFGPGQSSVVAVQFRNPSNAVINFTPVIYSGGLN